VIVLTRRYHFPAAHVLASRDLSASENDRIYGKCANPNGHGHNYGVEVSVAGTPDPETGHIVPPCTLDAIFDEAVRERYSHRMLNDLESFRRRVPTAENIAQVLFGELAPLVAVRTRARLANVRVVETSNNYFDVGEIG
jgi:6-pyruvoyltetrahydropterin/6-carboxytetrahydropterin synthase